MIKPFYLKEEREIMEVNNMTYIGIIGTGLMGSSIAKCLSSKGYKLILYNRTKEKALSLARKLGAEVASSPRELSEKTSYSIVFVANDEALYNVLLGKEGVIESSNKDHVVINCSTVTPLASSRVSKMLAEKGIGYIEAPVFGSTHEASECRLISIVAGNKDLVDNVVGFINDYSTKTFYAGDIPRATVLKLAINNIALSLPPILAESFALIEAWNINIDVLLNIIGNLWFGDAVRRYLPRIFEEKEPRFKVWMAGKDYSYVAIALKEKNLPSFVSSTFSSLYMMASQNGYKDKDYPQIARYFIEMARKIRDKNTSSN